MSMVSDPPYSMRQRLARLGWRPYLLIALLWLLLTAFLYRQGWGAFSLLGLPMFAGAILLATLAAAGLLGQGVFAKPASVSARKDILLSDTQPAPATRGPYTKAQLDALAAPGPAGSTELKIFLPIYSQTIHVDIDLSVVASGLQDKTVSTINEILAWTDADRSLIRNMLFSNAKKMEAEVDFRLPRDDPKHPCHFEHGLASVESKVLCQGLHIDETDELKSRFALFRLLPEWEAEHGIVIVVRNGKPIAVGNFQDDLRPYDTD